MIGIVWNLRQFRSVIFADSIIISRKINVSHVKLILLSVFSAILIIHPNVYYVNQAFS
jgi:hypothetical protein